MKQIFLIFAVAGCCNFLSPSYAQENFSLWPRRPAELEQARQLLSQGKQGEAVRLLQPFVHDAGVTGRESRQIAAKVNVPRYLSRMHPAAKVHTVKRGETLPKIAAVTKCPVDMLMLLNGLIEPSSLKVGQSLVYVDMQLRMEIYPSMDEVCVWDGEALVASYRVLGVKGSVDGSSGRETRIAAREAYMQGKTFPSSSAMSAVADKRLKLEDGTLLVSDDMEHGRYVRLDKRDLNELAQLLREENSVIWAADPQAGVSVAPERQEK